MPELVDQRLAGDDLVRAQEEKREQRPLLASAEGDEPAVADDLERTEDSELQPPRTLTPALPRGYRAFAGPWSAPPDGSHRAIQAEEEER